MLFPYTAMSSPVLQVSVGDPARAFSLLIDTGSSNTWVGASSENPFVVTSTSEDTGEEVVCLYSFFICPRMRTENLLSLRLIS